MPEPAIAPIARWRRVLDALARGVPADPDDAAWMVAAGQRHQVEAASGLTLDKALGLRHHGGASWWAEEARRRRDDAIRALYRARFAALSPGEAAARITTLVRRHHVGHTLEALGADRALVVAIVESGAAMPGARQLRDILGKSDA